MGKHNSSETSDASVFGVETVVSFLLTIESIKNVRAYVSVNDGNGQLKT